MFLGIDFGTSGARACVIDADRHAIAWQDVPIDPAINEKPGHFEQSAVLWWDTLETLINRLSTQIPLDSVRSLAIDGTSGTVLLCDTNGQPQTPALMYNDSRAQNEAGWIQQYAPLNSGAHGASSGLAKWLWLSQQSDGLIQTQADWLLGKLCGKFGLSDQNNALKLGYDPVLQQWPNWMNNLPLHRDTFPNVIAPGDLRGRIEPSLAKKWGFSPELNIVAGTTDSIAAVLATGAQLGQAVTSIGSTLVLKVISDKPVFSPTHGVYSHRFGEHWLVGGASNSGGAVLKQFFTVEQIKALSTKINTQHATNLHYYPLPSIGERFPIANAELPPKLTPRPESDVEFLQGLFEGIADIEVAGYRLLSELGCPFPSQILSAGGGAHNEVWRTIREQRLGVPVLLADSTDAAFGAAKLAQQQYFSKD